MKNCTSTIDTQMALIGRFGNDLFLSFQFQTLEQLYEKIQSISKKFLFGYLGMFITINMQGVKAQLFLKSKNPNHYVFYSMALGSQQFETDNIVELIKGIDLILQKEYGIDTVINFDNQSNLQEQKRRYSRQDAETMPPFKLKQGVPS